MKSSGGNDEFRRARRKLSAIFRSETHLRGINARQLSEMAEVHYNSVYRVLSGEDAYLSSYQRMARSLGLKLSLQDEDELLQTPQDVQVACPQCGQVQVINGSDESGWCVCAGCGTRMRVLKVVSYTARLETAYERGKYADDDE